MTRSDRLVTIGCYLVASWAVVAVLVLLAIVSGTGIGPLELVLALVLAVPAAVHVSRKARGLLQRAGHARLSRLRRLTASSR